MSTRSNIYRDKMTQTSVYPVLNRQLYVAKLKLSMLQLYNNNFQMPPNIIHLNLYWVEGQNAFKSNISTFQKFFFFWKTCYVLYLDTEHSSIVSIFNPRSTYFYLSWIGKRYFEVMTLYYKESKSNIHIFSIPWLPEFHCKFTF